MKYRADLAAELSGLVVSALEEGLKCPNSTKPHGVYQHCEGQCSDCIREKQKNNHLEDGVTQGIGNKMDHVTALHWIPISYIPFKLLLFIQNLKVVHRLSKNARGDL